MKNLAVTVLFLVMLVISMVSGASLRRYNNNGGHASYHSSSNVTTTTTTKHHKHKKGHHTKTSSHVPTSTSSPIGGSGTTYTGDGTWFNTGLGSCGWTNSDTEYIAALDAPLMNNPANPNKNPLCGRMIEVTNQANNKSVKVKIVDTCPPCLSGSVDMSPSAFSQIADLDTGRIKISWQYID